MATTLEERFFGPGNRFQWPDIERNNLPQSVMTRLTPWIEDLQHKTETLLLPRASKTDPTKWYGMARNDRAFSVFRDEIVAFIGATYSDYSLASCRLNDADPIDAALMQEFGRNLFVFTVSGDHQNIVHERLLLHRRLSLERPKRQEVSYRPTGRILGEFDEAIRQNDVEVFSSKITTYLSFNKPVIGAIDKSNEMYNLINNNCGVVLSEEYPRIPISGIEYEKYVNNSRITKKLYSKNYNTNRFIKVLAS